MVDVQWNNFDLLFTFIPEIDCDGDLPGNTCSNLFCASMNQ